MLITTQLQTLPSVRSTGVIHIDYNYNVDRNLVKIK